MECFCYKKNKQLLGAEETSKDEVEKKWRRLRDVIEGVRARKELCLLIEDLNKLVGNNTLGVPGNSSKISLGSKLLLELLAIVNCYLMSRTSSSTCRERWPWLGL